MMSSYRGFKTIFHDPDYYAESLRAFARLSSKYQVLATWTDTVFPKIVVKRLAVDLTDTKGKLKVLGVGSGTNFRKSFANYQKFRALQTLPLYSYYQYLLIATPGEAQQQKWKAVHELTGEMDCKMLQQLLVNIQIFPVLSLNQP
ncbi:hypothetical protein HOLleu_04852 [Holothuria leucospilota]|uniref:Uncharacterized protein n=1 Tax=Holothuria leucospilota TaxID=206669 RepID=A0A9Q1CJ02_HOLLE|nr:hypothetical protein HOLleu_04852 [Holothuria leucospilota]